MVFGKNKDRGIRLKGLTPEVITIGNGVSTSDLLVHDEHDQTLAYLLGRMTPPNFPTPVGVLFSTERPTIESLMNKQIQDAVEKSGPGNIDTLLRRGDVWSVE